MKASDVISSKLLKQWPESWKIFEESCQYSIENGLDHITFPLLFRERKIEWSEVETIKEQVFKYLEGLGYNNILGRYKEIFCTREGFESGYIFTVFLSPAGIKSYLAECDKWQASIARKSGFDKESPRPIYDSIRYLNIYKGKR